MVFSRYFDGILMCFGSFVCHVSTDRATIGAGHRHSSKAMGSPGSDRFDGGAGACGACGGELGSAQVMSA